MSSGGQGRPTEQTATNYQEVTLTSTSTSTSQPATDKAAAELPRPGDFVTITPDGACSGRDWRPLRRGCVLEVSRVDTCSNDSGAWVVIEGIEIGKRGAPLRDWLGCEKERTVYANTASIAGVRRALVTGDEVRDADGRPGTVARAYRDRETGRRMCRLYTQPGETDGRRVPELDLQPVDLQPVDPQRVDPQPTEDAHQDQPEPGPEVVADVASTEAVDVDQDHDQDHGKDHDAEQTDLPALSRRRNRKPSPRQVEYLTDIAHHDGVPAYLLPRYGSYGISTEVAVMWAGWVEVDRGTPDNRGGDRREYRHTITAAGRDALARAGVSLPAPTAPADQAADSERADQAEAVDQAEADPMAIECDGCGADPGEPCWPFCQTTTGDPLPATSTSEPVDGAED